MKARRKHAGPVRYAVVGLGHFAQTAILPAFERAKKSELVALVSDDAKKLVALGKRHRVEHKLDYDEYDSFLRSGAADAVFIALPNDLHAEYTERAAAAGVHVLCEKPMAVTVAEGERMARACKAAGKKLMIGYRLHFEKANLSVIETVRSGKLGKVRAFSSIFSMQVKPDNVRLSREHGGGPLHDIGIYCINAARYVFGSEPLEAFAFSGRPPADARFDEVEAQLGITLRFSEDRLATIWVGFDAAHASRYEVLGTRGRLALDPAYSYNKDLDREIHMGEKVSRRTFKKVDQVAGEISYFSECINEDKEPEPGAKEGLADLRVIEAIQKSVETQRPVAVARSAAPKRPNPKQERNVKGRSGARPVHASSPHS